MVIMWRLARLWYAALLCGVLTGTGARPFSEAGEISYPEDYGRWERAVKFAHPLRNSPVVIIGTVLLDEELADSFGLNIRGYLLHVHMVNKRGFRVRIGNITSNDGEVACCSSAQRRTIWASNRFHYWAVETGVHHYHGLQIAAEKWSTTSRSEEVISFPQIFATTPTLLVAVHGTHKAVPRVSIVNRIGFRSYLQDAFRDTVMIEQGYIAVTNVGVKTIAAPNSHNLDFIYTGQVYASHLLETTTAPYTSSQPADTLVFTSQISLKGSNFATTFAVRNREDAIIKAAVREPHSSTSCCNWNNGGHTGEHIDIITLSSGSGDLPVLLTSDICHESSCGTLSACEEIHDYESLSKSTEEDYRCPCIGVDVFKNFYGTCEIVLSHVETLMACIQALPLPQLFVVETTLAVKIPRVLLFDHHVRKKNLERYMGVTLRNMLGTRKELCSITAVKRRTARKVTKALNIWLGTQGYGNLTPEPRNPGSGSIWKTP